MPPRPVPAFPDNIPACVAAWNATFRVDFFTCRAVLRRIGQSTLEATRARVLDRADVPRLLPAGDYRLFFVDDDDWFAPDTEACLGALGEEDVAVFPLARLAAPRAVTFVREAPPPGSVVGQPSRFWCRYQTNGYALHPRLCAAPLLARLDDHITASEAAGPLGLRDAYHDILLAATNKSPVSASILTDIARDQDLFRARVEDFRTMLRRTGLPPRAAWLAGPIRATLALFDEVLG